MLESIVAITKQFALRLVRGAYIEKERERARADRATRRVFDHKQETDNAYNTALDLCIANHQHVAVNVATHNSDSCLLLINLLKDADLLHSTHHFAFSQLLGMCDPLSCGLAHQGFKVDKYVPYGPVVSSFPYLSRRAGENSSIGGSTPRELGFLDAELRRRGKQMVHIAKT